MACSRLVVPFSPSKVERPSDLIVRSMAIKFYVGLDVSLETTAICVIDEHGRQVEITGAASDPQAIAMALRRHANQMVRIVLESGQLSTWLNRQLRTLGLPVVCIDARQAHRALSGRLNKSDPPMPRDWRSWHARVGSARFTSRA
jgi:hypothetical protein